MSRAQILFGVALVLSAYAGVTSKLGFGRLPGDIVIERENFRLHIPLATSIIVSASFVFSSGC